MADSSGNATVVLLDTLSVGQVLTLTVTGYNRIPHVAQITVHEPPPVMMLTYAPTSFDVATEADSAATAILYIMNTAGATDTLGFTLTFSSFVEDGSFLDLNPAAGQVPSGETTAVVLTFSSRGLGVGTYGGTIVVHPEVGSDVSIPVVLQVDYGVADVSVGRGTPRAVVLEAARPNPFAASATLQYALPTAQAARLVIYDASGRAIRILARGTAAAGYHSVEWNGRDDAGRAVPAGVYFARLQTEGQSLTQRLLHIR